MALTSVDRLTAESSTDRLGARLESAASGEAKVVATIAVMETVFENNIAKCIK